MSQFRLYFQDKALHRVSREILRERLQEMAEKGGWWNFTTTQANYTPTRYKYLFDCVYKNALPEAVKKYKIWNPSKQDFEYIKTAQDLHTCMKTEFMRIQIYNTETCEIMTTIDSSTRLEDKAFYQVFEEKVIQHLTEMGCFDADGCMSRDEWAEMKHPKKEPI
jgi:hypothetical protein